MPIIGDFFQASIFGLGAILKAVEPVEERLACQKQFIEVTFEGDTHSLVPGCPCFLSDMMEDSFFSYILP